MEYFCQLSFFSIFCEEFAYLAAGKKESSCAEVLEIRYAVETQRLGLGGFLAGSLAEADESVLMDTYGAEAVPSLFQDGKAGLLIEKSFANAPGKSISKE